MLSSTASAIALNSQVTDCTRTWNPFWLLLLWSEVQRIAGRSHHILQKLLQCIGIVGSAPNIQQLVSRKDSDIEGMPVSFARYVTRREVLLLPSCSSGKIDFGGASKKCCKWVQLFSYAPTEKSSPKHHEPTQAQPCDADEHSQRGHWPAGHWCCCKYLCSRDWVTAAVWKVLVGLTQWHTHTNLSCYILLSVLRLKHSPNTLSIQIYTT